MGWILAAVGIAWLALAALRRRQRRARKGLPTESDRAAGRAAARAGGGDHRHRRGAERRPRRAAGAADPGRAGDGRQHRADAVDVRPPHLRHRRQRRGGAARGHSRAADPDVRLHARVADRGGGRDHGRLAAARGQPVLGRRRSAADVDRRAGRRGREPVRRSRLGLGRAAGRAS